MKNTDKNNRESLSPDSLTDDFNGLMYFSHEQCGVCQVLRPKVEQMVAENYPELEFMYINVRKTPAIAAAFSVFTVPVILVFFEGQEFYRFARNIGVGELQRSIERPYGLKFG